MQAPVSDFVPEVDGDNPPAVPVKDKWLVTPTRSRRGSSLGRGGEVELPVYEREEMRGELDAAEVGRESGRERGDWGLRRGS